MVLEVFSWSVDICLYWDVYFEWHLSFYFHFVPCTLVLVFFSSWHLNYICALFLMLHTLYTYQRELLTCKIGWNYPIQWCFQHPVLLQWCLLNILSCLFILNKYFAYFRYNFLSKFYFSITHILHFLWCGGRGGGSNVCF